MADAIPNDLVPVDDKGNPVPSDLVEVDGPIRQQASAAPSAIPNDLVPVGTDHVPPPTQPQSQPLNALKYGIQEQIIPAAVRAGVGITDKLGLSDSTNPANFSNTLKQAASQIAPQGYTPQTTTDKAIAFATSMADPAGLGLFKAGELAVNPLVKVFGLGEKAAALAGTASAPAIEAGIANTRGAITNAAQKYLATAMKSAAGAGAISGTQEALNETGQGNIKPSQLLAQTAKGMATGFVAGPALQALADTIVGGAKTISALKSGGPEEAASGPLSSPTIAQKVHEAYTDAIQTVNAKASILGIPEDKIGTVTQQTFLENLHQAGIPVYDKNALPSGVGKSFLRSVEKYSAVDNKTGTNATETAYNLIQGQNEYHNTRADLLQQLATPLKNLNKLGVDNEQAYNLLRYTEDTPDGNIAFNPSELNTPGNVRPQWQGPAPASEVMQELQQLRHTISSTLIDNPAYAEKAGYVQGYVPLMNKQTGEFFSPNTTRGIAEPGFTQERTSGVFDPNQHEGDLGVVLNSWANKVAKFKAFNKFLPQLSDEVTKLNYLNQGDAAQDLMNTAMRTMGIRSKTDLSSMFTDKFLAQHQDMLNDVARRLPDPDSFWDQALHVARNAMYNNFVFMNPRTLIKHALQPEFVGGGEIGPKWVAAGRVGLLNADGRALAHQMLPLMKAKDAGILEDANFQPLKSPIAKGINAALSFPGRIGGKIIDLEDSSGRMTSFLGAYKQLQSAFAEGGEEAATGAMDGLLPGEKNLVAKAYQQGGADAASQMYGVIRARRIHYAYGLADTPNAFASDLGKYIPFTTWGGNQLMRVAGDLQNGNYASLAKRVVMPLAYIAAFRALTGYDIPGAHPLAAAPEGISANAFPWLANTVEAAKSKGIGAATDQLLNATPVGQIDNTLRNLKRSSSDAGEAILRLRKLQGAPLERALPEKPSWNSMLPRIIKEMRDSQ